MNKNEITKNIVNHLNKNSEALELGSSHFDIVTDKVQELVSDFSGSTKEELKNYMRTALFNSSDELELSGSGLDILVDYVLEAI